LPTLKTIFKFKRATSRTGAIRSDLRVSRFVWCRGLRGAIRRICLSGLSIGGIVSRHLGFDPLHHAGTGAPLACRLEDSGAARQRCADRGFSGWVDLCPADWFAAPSACLSRPRKAGGSRSNSGRLSRPLAPLMPSSGNSSTMIHPCRRLIAPVRALR
jgi:hypothetical protein